METISKSVIVVFMFSMKLSKAPLNELPATRICDTDFFSAAVFSSIVMKATFTRYHLSAESSQNISAIFVLFADDTE